MNERRYLVLIRCNDCGKLIEVDSLKQWYCDSCSCKRNKDNAKNSYTLKKKK